MFEVLSKGDNAAFVTGHDENLSSSHVANIEQTDNFVRHLWPAVSSGLRGRRNETKKSRPQNGVVTMNHRGRHWIGFVNRGMRQRFRRRNRSAFVADPVLFEIVRHDPYAIPERQLGETACRRTGYMKIAGRAISDAQVTKADSV